MVHKLLLSFVRFGMLAKGQGLHELEFCLLLRDPVKAEESFISFCNGMLESLICLVSAVNLQENVQMAGGLSKHILA